MEVLFKALKEREDMCPTCINEGVAVPHSRNALVGLVRRPVLAYGRHRRGVAFGALDYKPIHHFFLLCAPNVREHLQLLARLAQLINKPEFRDGLMAAESPDQLMALIKRMEQS
jgi:mannitol/fructose-specific phosphotransferase system IIA component (Ntr-type)